MTAQIKEVPAFQSEDGKVFATYTKAHHRSIWCLTRMMFGLKLDEDDDDDYQSKASAAKLLYDRLTAGHHTISSHTKQAILRLAEELK